MLPSTPQHKTEVLQLEKASELGGHDAFRALPNDTKVARQN